MFKRVLRQSAWKESSLKYLVSLEICCQIASRRKQSLMSRREKVVVQLCALRRRGFLLPLRGAAVQPKGFIEGALAGIWRVSKGQIVQRLEGSVMA